MILRRRCRSLRHRGPRRARLFYFGLVAAAYLLGGPAWALLVAGVAAILAALDGRRPGGES